MELPNLPTDNMYKFMAFSGLAILLFTFYFGYTQAIEIKNKINEIELEKNLLALEIKQYGALMERLKKSGNTTSEQLNESEKVLNEMERRGVIINEKERILKYLIRSVNQLNYVILISLIVGSLLFAIGCRLWYKRVQYYQDLAIKSNINTKLST